MVSKSDIKSYFSFQWHITDRCDQRCKHCYIYGSGPAGKPCEMQWPQMMTVLQNCLDFCGSYGYSPIFFITGGDPLLHPDFMRLAKLLHQKQIPFVVMCNPFHLTTWTALRLKKLGCLRVQLSIDGTENTHDAIRKPGSYKATIRAIERLNRVGLTSAVMTTVSGANIREMPEIIDAAVKAKAGLFSFARYCPVKGEEGNGITPEAYREMLVNCDRQIRELISAGCRTVFDKKDHLWTLLDYEEGRFKLPDDGANQPDQIVVYGGCNCGRSHLTILPNGDVYACRRIPDSKVGNALTQQLTYIWIAPMKPYREYEAMERCAKCKLMPWCRGCPAVAKSTYGRLTAGDPQCWH